MQLLNKHEIDENTTKTVLDVCCGGRMFYFDKQNNNVLFCDNREAEYVLSDGRTFIVRPDKIEDFTNLSFDDESFNLVVFDPPHLKYCGQNSWLAKKYGVLGQDWKEDLRKAFDECWRVLKNGGTLIFKWNEDQIKKNEVLALFSKSPLFGHVGHSAKTHWYVFYKG